MDPALNQEYPKIAENVEASEYVAHVASTLFDVWSKMRQFKKLSSELENEPIDQAIIDELKIHIWG